MSDLILYELLENRIIIGQSSRVNIGDTIVAFLHLSSEVKIHKMNQQKDVLFLVIGQSVSMRNSVLNVRTLKPERFFRGPPTREIL